MSKIKRGDHPMPQQQKPKLILIAQALLMLGVALAPAQTGFRFFWPQDIWDWIGTGLAILGCLIVLVALHALRKAFTIEAAAKQGTQLITHFPFTHSRNPMYVGGLLMSLAWSLLQRSWLAALLTLALGIVLNLKVRIEEKNLELLFGEAYRSYKNSVRRYF
ncbi:MAG TPA: isoprenylcysteine carboxylmethyltransferase family protein [Pseudobdellovibrionaceae bacterium]|nr:isoprenylcysteine carboxylmethyltransferase family protein [Pseudobdellovibrionaceae bacterium]